MLPGHHRLPVSCCQALGYCHPSHTDWKVETRPTESLLGHKEERWKYIQVFLATVTEVGILRLHLWCLVSCGGRIFCSLCLPFPSTGTLLLDRRIRELGEVNVCTAAYPEDVYVQHVCVYSFLFTKKIAPAFIFSSNYEADLKGKGWPHLNVDLFCQNPSWKFNTYIILWCFLPP